MAAGTLAGNCSGGSRVPRRAPWILLAAAMIASATTLVWLGRGTGFIFDEWYFWAGYHPVTFTNLLAPDNGNLVLLPVFFYQVVIKLLGLTYLPYRIAEVAMVLATVALFFVALRAGDRRREWLVLGPAILLLFFGSSWDVINNPIGFPSLIGLACGLGAMIAVERNTLRCDLLAFALLATGLASFTTTVPFVVAVAVIMLLDRPRRWPRLAFPAALMLAYAAYRLHYRDFPTIDGNKITLDHLLHAPVSFFESLQAALLALVGIYPFGLSAGAWDFSSLVLIALLATFVGWRIATRKPIDRRVWAYLAALFTLWLSLAALGKDPAASRYQFAAAILLFAIFIEMLVGTRIRAPLGAVAVTVLCFSLVSNTVELFETRQFSIVNAHRNEAKLAGLEIIREQVPFNFGMQHLANPETPFWTLDIYIIQTGEYFAAVDRDGSPAMSEPELRSGSDEQRESADRLMFNGLQLPERLGPAPLVDCRPARPDGEGGWTAATGPIAAAGFGVRARARVTAQMRRYADVSTTYPLHFDGPRGTWLEIPTDLSPVPWRAELRSQAPFLTCAQRGTRK